jgi:hypothetical protein
LSSASLLWSFQIKNIHIDDGVKRGVGREELAALFDIGEVFFDGTGVGRMDDKPNRYNFDHLLRIAKQHFCKF